MAAIKGRLLIIAGSDSGGGAGIQADIKTACAMGVYAATAITAVTVQDTQRVYDVHGVPPETIVAQIKAVLGDIGADAIKVGMIGSAAAADAVAGCLQDYRSSPAAQGVPIVIDPVLVATSGDALAQDETAGVLKEKLIPLASLLTPNLAELAALTDMPTESREDILSAAGKLIDAGAEAVLAKGGHGGGDRVDDYLVTDDRVTTFDHPRQKTSNTHGTGCTLAAAAASGLAAGLPLQDAVGQAITYVQKAMAAAPGFGKGHGPLNHLVDPHK
ncbi:MAG: bifunctional hydroxymethylpyrimidine kinase/phosphomethylpyrimidine kinase [Pseudomonadota bacterium]